MRNDQDEPINYKHQYKLDTIFALVTTAMMAIVLLLEFTQFIQPKTALAGMAAIAFSKLLIHSQSYNFFIE